MTFQEIISELQGIFADAEAGTDLANIEHRLAIAATKLDALSESSASDGSPVGKDSLRFLTTTLDAIRAAIGNDQDKAFYYIKALSELCRGNDDAAEDALDRFSVGQFLKENGLR